MTKRYNGEKAFYFNELIDFLRGGKDVNSVRRDLGRLLKNLRHEARGSAIVFLMLRRKEEQMPEMCWYMEEHPEATADELMQKAEELRQKGELNEAP